MTAEEFDAQVPTVLFGSDDAVAPADDAAETPVEEVVAPSDTPVVAPTEEVVAPN